jgi:tetratricopeptide (TPR) repeat protein
MGAGKWGEGAAMTTTLKIEDFDLPPETEDEVYASLLRALRRKQGFGLFFVQCTPAQGQDVMARLREDLGGKRLATVDVGRETTTLYEEIEGLWEREPFDVLFVQGLEQALYGYEDTKRLMGWTSEGVYSYSWRGVPPILNHLNQRRDKLRNHFPACFVFLVPVFVVDYFLQRAADFLDWRSGLFVFPRDPESLEQDIKQALTEGDYDKYLTMPSEIRRKRILELKDLYRACNSLDKKADLLWELGRLFRAEGEYESAISSFDQLIEIKPDDKWVWNSRGNALSDIGRFQEAILNYDQAVKLSPINATAYCNRGVTQSALGDLDAAIQDFDQAIKLNPANATAYYNRGLAYRALGDNQSASNDFHQAIKLNPEDLDAHINRGFANRALDHMRDEVRQSSKLNLAYSSESIRVLIRFSDEDLDDDEQDMAAMRLLEQLRDLDELESVERVSAPVPAGSKGLGFLTGLLMAQVNRSNVQKLFGFLGNRLAGKTIELEVEGNGRKLKVKASSREELKAAIAEAEKFIASRG